jgi:hypothetical protein
MRVALGAGRGRLVRQCLTESAVLAVSGGVLGVLLAAFSTRPFLMFWPGSLPRAEEVHFDWHVLLFAVAASLLSGLLFGLAPALRASARNLEQALRAGGRILAGSSRRLHSGLVASEIALAVVLLVAAVMLGRTLLRLSSVDPGVDIRSVLITRVALSMSAFSDPPTTRAAWRDLLDRVRHVSGVRSVAMTDLVPMDGDDEEIGYWTSETPPPANQMPLSLMFMVMPDYLKTMGLPLLRGRFFDEHDRIGNEVVVAIDEVMPQRAFGGRDPSAIDSGFSFLAQPKS